MRGILLTSFLSRKDVREMQVSRQRFHQLERKMNNACTCALHMENTISCSCQWKRWREMREWGGFPSLPSFKGRRWGKFIFLFIIHTNTIIRQPNEFKISSRIQWYDLFVSIRMLKGAAQQNIWTLLFFRIRGYLSRYRINWYLPVKTRSSRTRRRLFSLCYDVLTIWAMVHSTRAKGGECDEPICAHVFVNNEEKIEVEGDFSHLLPLKEGGEGNLTHLSFSLHCFILCGSEMAQSMHNTLVYPSSILKFTCVQLIIRKRKWGIFSSPPAFEGRRWGKSFLFFIFINNTIVNKA